MSAAAAEAPRWTWTLTDGERADEMMNILPPVGYWGEEDGAFFVGEPLTHEMLPMRHKVTGEKRVMSVPVHELFVPLEPEGERWKGAASRWACASVPLPKRRQAVEEAKRLHSAGELG